MPRGSASNNSLDSPIVGGGRHIRVLTLQGATGTYDPIICTLGLADLDDRTGPYNDAMETFEHTYPNDDLSRTRKASARHFFWNYWNLDSVRARMGWDDDMALKVARHETLYDFCDRPRRTFGDAMPDRFKWGDYLALSYVCGDLNDGRTIEVNKIPFEVGRNLYNALIRLRQSYEVKDRKLKVWVDAICINQLNPVEKAAEVTRMNLIYSEALVTWAWLGQRQSDSTLGPFKEHFSACLSAIDALGMGDVAEVMKFSRSLLTELDVEFMIRRLGSIKGRRTESTPLQLLDTFQFLGTSNVMAQDLPPYFAFMVKLFIESDTYTYFLWCIIDAISEAPYWHRSWINQEMALSSSIAF